MLTTDDAIKQGLAEVIKTGNFKLPDIPTNVLGLIGISGGSYVISKGIQKAGTASSAAPPVVTPPKDPPG